MSPIQLIKQGLQTGDWNSISEAYQGLTGEKLSPPQQSEPKYHDLLNRLGRFVEEEFDKVRGQVQTLENRPVPKKRGRKKASPKQSMPEVEPQQEEEGDEIDEVDDESPGRKDDPFAKFRMAEPKKKASGRTPNRPNRFTDDLTMATGPDLEFSQKFSQSAPTKSYRPKMRKVSVVCDQCGKKDKVPQPLVPPTIEKEKSLYLCERCLRG